MAKSDSSQDTYVAVAARVFARQGYHGASLAAVAQEAGVSKQALLHFFGTKERLYEAVLTDLSDRLQAGIDKVADPDPVAHLMIYFQALRASVLAKPDDLTLMTRALLDSSEAARKWPLKPYLDKLILIARETPGGRHTSDEAILAWLAQMIGMIQYLAISEPTMAGMYGKTVSDQIASKSESITADAVRSFVT